MSDLPTDGAFLDGFTFFKNLKQKRPGLSAQS